MSKKISTADLNFDFFGADDTKTDIIEKKNEEKDEDIKIKIGELKISNMVAIVKTNMSIPNLDTVIKDLPITEHSSKKDGIVKIKGKLSKDDKKGTIIVRGIQQKDLGSSKKKPETGLFFNQVTMIVRFFNDKDKEVEINVKLFDKGTLQLTGIRDEMIEPYKATKLIYKALHEHMPSNVVLIEIRNKKNKNKDSDNDKGDNKNKDGNDKKPIKFKIQNVSIELINSLFQTTNLNINRSALVNVLHTYNIVTTFEPDTYPGVNIKYFWREETVGTDKEGCCNCKPGCTGKKEKKNNILCDSCGRSCDKDEMVVAYDNKTKKELHFSDEDCLKNYNEKHKRNLRKSVKCKRLSIMAFQSGSTLITAGKSRQDLTDAFNFISGIYKKHNKEIRLKQSSLIVEPTTSKKQKKSLIINKSNIRLSDDLLKKLNIKR